MSQVSILMHKLQVKHSETHMKTQNRFSHTFLFSVLLFKHAHLCIKITKSTEN